MQNIDLSNAKGILFKTEMVRAILEGRKTQTRRIPDLNVLKKYWDLEEQARVVGAQCESEKEYYMYRGRIHVGDILYVRETWAKVPITAYGSEIIYKATFDRTYGGGWKPSLFMPKEAARIFLKVTSKKVERVQYLTEEDAIAEGFNSKVEFLNYFDKLNKLEEKNPYVWVYGFERVN